LGWMKNNFYADSWRKFDCSRHNLVFFKLFDFKSLFGFRQSWFECRTQLINLF
jgi:hypothetical protein